MAAGLLAAAALGEDKIQAQKEKINTNKKEPPKGGFVLDGLKFHGSFIGYLSLCQ